MASLLGGPPDRLPLLEASRQLARLHDQPLPDLWRELILSWVLAQHVRWSIARNDDGKQRLRLTLDDEGWIQLRPTARGAALMADRIETTLSLGAECGLFVESNNISGERRFEAAEIKNNGRLSARAETPELRRTTLVDVNLSGRDSRRLEPDAQIASDMQASPVNVNSL